VSATCTQASAAHGEPLTATAATARTWLLLEQPGPWGGKALTSSHLDPAVGRALEDRTARTGVRVALIRRPGRHADPRGQAGPRHPAAANRPAEPRRRVILAHTAPDDPWIRTADLADPAAVAALADLDFTALGAGDPRGFGVPYDGPPLAFVCTNARRDRCCALLGRPLASELAASYSTEHVWEVTHLGGHRFAPTMLVLPHGYTYGRLDGGQAKGVLEAARDGRVPFPPCRGRSAWDRPGQAAELAVRALTGEDRADALTVTSTEEAPAGRDDGDGDGDGDGTAWTVAVAHRDGRAWRVAVVRRASGPPRPESCGAALGTPARMDVEDVHEVTV
jgi:hypothetical protein